MYIHGKQVHDCVKLLLLQNMARFEDLFCFEYQCDSYCIHVLYVLRMYQNAYGVMDSYLYDRKIGGSTQGQSLEPIDNFLRCTKAPGKALF